MINTKRRALLAAIGVSGLAVVMAPISARADTFPTKQVRIIVPFGAGNSTDLASRLIARRLEERWKQTVIVENKPGAGGVIGLDLVAKSAPDGHTLVMTGPGLATLKVLNKTVPFDPDKDLAPVSLVYNAYGAIATNANVPARTLSEFVAYAKSHRGQLNYGSLGRNTVLLGFEAFKAATDIEMNEVPYPSGPAANQALLRNDVQLVNSTAVQLAPHAEAGKIQILAVTTQARLPILPNAPTLAEAGFAHLKFPTWSGLLVRGGTPRDVIQKISAEVASILAEPEVRKALFDISAEPVGTTPEEFARTIDSDRRMWTDVAKRANIQPE